MATNLTRLKLILNEYIFELRYVKSIREVRSESFLMISFKNQDNSSLNTFLDKNVFVLPTPNFEKIFSYPLPPKKIVSPKLSRKIQQKFITIKKSIGFAPSIPKFTKSRRLYLQIQKYFFKLSSVLQRTVFIFSFSLYCTGASDFTSHQHFPVDLI